MLHRELKQFGHNTIKIRNFQQDALENFFGRIRQRGQRFVNPTCASFTPIYKSCLINGLVSKHSLGANCESDNGDILITLEKFFISVSHFF